MRSNPSASRYLEHALALARFEVGMYEVTEVLPRPIANACGHAAVARYRFWHSGCGVNGTRQRGRT
jgi:hypothetical protein